MKITTFSDVNQAVDTVLVRFVFTVLAHSFLKNQAFILFFILRNFERHLVSQGFSFNRFSFLEAHLNGSF